MTDIADVRERLARIETKLDLVIGPDGHDPRIRKLERKQSWIIGVGTGAVAFFGLVLRAHS